MPRRPLGLLLALALLAAPLTVKAPPRDAVPRLGVLTPAAEASTPLWEALRQGPRALGYVEGQHILLDHRVAAGKPARLAARAAEPVRPPVDLLVADGTRAARAAQDATTTPPIAMAVGGAPGGDGTGVSATAPGLGGTRRELLQEALPQVSRVAALWGTGNPTRPAQGRALEAAARALGVPRHPLEAPDPGALDRIFAAMTRAGAEALLTLAAPARWTHRPRVVGLTARRRLPAMFPARGPAEAGGVMAYGPRVPGSFRRAAVDVDRLLKGATPGDLPVEQPTPFALVIDLETVEILGLTSPPAVLRRADEVRR